MPTWTTHGDAIKQYILLETLGRALGLFLLCLYTFLLLKENSMPDPLNPRESTGVTL